MPLFSRSPRPEIPAPLSSIAPPPTRWSQWAYVAVLVGVVVLVLMPPTVFAGRRTDGTTWLLVDVSRSMLAQVGGGSTLDLAKRIIEESSLTAPVAVIAYAGEARLVLPPAPDWQRHVDILTHAVVPKGGSNPKAALDLVQQLAGPTDRIVLVTDGGHQGEELDRLSLANRLSIVAVGPERPTPIRLKRGLLRRGSDPVLVERDDAWLRQLASATGGRIHVGRLPPAATVPGQPHQRSDRSLPLFVGLVGLGLVRLIRNEE